MDFGPYRLITRLGAGGMGEVWRAEDTRLLRPVAIKILSANVADDPEWKIRFFHEARTVAQLNHPHIATIHAIEEAGSTVFIVMELVEGESLGRRLERGPLTVAETFRLARECADGLGEAHEKQIVHRDIKPDNIILSRRGAKLLDFGIAKQIGATKPAAVTQAGVVMGTIYYMSPEQALGKEVDARTDIFALGAVLYECLAGRRAFDGHTPAETLMRVITQEPEDLATLAPKVPKGLIDVVKKAMSKHPEDRFQSMDELAVGLTHVDPSAPPGPRAQRRSSSTEVTTAAIPPSAQPSSRPKYIPEPPPGAFHRASVPDTPGSTPQPMPPQQQPQPPSPRGLGNGRALIADDDPIARKIVGTILSRNGIPYDEAENGAEAVKYLKAQEYSFVFVDLLMPRIDGWGVLDFIRRTRADKAPNLYLITGVINQSLSTADRELVRGIIYKPLVPEEVERAVKAALVNAR